MGKILPAFVCLLALAGAAFASEEEELGVVMKGGDAPSEAAAKSRELAGKYDRAKQRAAEALGVEGPLSSDPEAAEVEKSAPAAQVSKAAAVEGSDTVYLTNGQTIPDAKILREDAGGIWIDLGGAEVYFTRQEIKSVERGAS